jgi:uncharacterized protein (DUF1800 family)
MRRRVIRFGLFHTLLAAGHHNPAVLVFLLAVVVLAVVMAIRNRRG